MSSLLRRVLLPPVYEDAPRTRRALLIHVFSVGWMVITTAAFALIILVQPELTRFTLSALGRAWIVMGAVTALNALGRQPLAAFLLIAGYLGTIVLTAIKAGGIRSPGVQSFMVIAFMAALVYTETAGVVVGAACVLITFGLAAAEHHAFIHQQVAPYNVWVLWILNTRYVALFVFTLYISMRSLNEAVSRSEAAERKKQLALDSAAMGVWRHDPKTGDFHGDRRGFEIFGLPMPADRRFPFAAWLEMMHPEDRAQAMVGFDSAVKGAKNVRIEYRIRRPDGEERHIEVTASAVTDAKGRHEGVVGVVSDATKKRKAELDREKLVLDLGERVKEIRLLHSAAQLLKPDRPFDREVLAALAEMMPRAWMHPEVCAARVSYQGLTAATPDWRETPWMQTAAFSTAAGSGALEIAYIRSRPAQAEGPFLAEERALIESLAEMLRAYLDHDQAEKARRAAEDQLRQAQKMEAFGRLAGGVAHDFNNILTAMMGYSQLLMGALPAGDQRRADAEEIAKSCERASSLTGQLLAFSRKQVIKPRSLDLNAVVRDIAAMLKRVINEDAKIVLDLAPEPVTVLADKGQLDQVILNLVVNARDAMPKGGVVTISVARAGADAVLTVSDTGTGMSDEVKARVFEPFFTTKETGKGTGLGLSVVYGVVNQNGGRIEIDTAPGKGTSFRVLLPATSAPAAAPPERTAPASGGSETVLLIDDDGGIRKMAARVLRQCGYTVIEAANADEALSAASLHAGALHLLLADVVLPGPGGRQVAENLHRLRPDMRILFMSGYANDTVMLKGVAHDKVSFLQKPFTPTMLAAKVRETLDASA